jgi:hypothetical protein
MDPPANGSVPTLVDRAIHFSIKPTFVGYVIRMT